MVGTIRIRRQNPDLWYETNPNGWAWVVLPDEASLIPELTQHHFEDWFPSEPDERIHERENVRLIRYWTSSKGNRYVIDATRVKRFRQRFRSLFHTTRAERTWMTALAAVGAGLPVPQPVSLGLHRRGGMVQETLIVYRALPGGAPAVRVLQMKGDEQRRFRRWFAPAVGRLVVQLWRAEMHHRRLNPGNLLVHGWPEKPTLWFVGTKHIDRLTEPPDLEAMARLLADLHDQWFPVLRTGRIRRTDILYALRTVALAVGVEQETLIPAILSHLDASTSNRQPGAKK